jgi:hypothetical protein
MIYLHCSKNATSFEVSDCDCVLFSILRDTGTVTVNTLSILKLITDGSPHNDQYGLAKGSEYLVLSEVIQSLQREASAES